MTDIEIARSIKLEKITDVAQKFGITEDDIELYGKYKAKISSRFINKTKGNKDGNLILVTAINPTPLGEGKTTVAIGLSDALNKIGEKSVLALREPSLGPVFGIKGGATKTADQSMVDYDCGRSVSGVTVGNNLSLSEDEALSKYH